MSEQQREQLYKRKLANLASYFHLTDPPSANPIRWILPEEVGTVQGGCINQAGFKTTPSGDGHGFTVDFGEASQRSALGLAWYTCAATYPVDPRTDSAVWSTAQNQAAYEYLTTSLIPCLKRIGANPPAAPSLAVYLDNPATAWEYPEPGNGRQSNLWYAQCPPDPPSKAILGEK